MSRPVLTHCRICHRPLPISARGRPRLTCSDACRQRLRRLLAPSDRRRWDRQDRAAERILRAYERRLGPLPDTPTPDGAPGLRWRLAFRLVREMPINTCSWCGRPFLPAEGAGSRVFCCSAACRQRRREFLNRLRAALIHFGDRVDGRIFVRLRLNQPALNRPVMTLPDMIGFCAGCGIPFPRDHRPRRYCSKRCRQAAGWRRQHGKPRGRTPCKRCGRRFTVTQDGKEYCSEHCRKLASNRRWYAKRRKTHFWGVCIVCGKTIPPNKGGGPARQTCGTRCKDKAARMRRKQRKEMVAPRRCRWCGKALGWEAQGSLRYCSDTCKKAMKAQQKRLAYHRQFRDR